MDFFSASGTVLDNSPGKAHDSADMRKVINHLVQLQDLIFTRDEQRSLPNGAANLDRLNDSIDRLIEELPQEVRLSFQRLYKRDHVTISPMHDGMCPMCGMKLASATVQAVKLCREIQTCPSCTRFLYDSEGPKWVAERPRRAAAERAVTGIARFSSEKLMVADLKAKTRDEAIAELARTMQEGGFVDDAGKLTEAALARESIVSTSLGHGAAFPHVRGIEGGGLSVALGISHEGILFDPADEEPCHFIFLTTIPTAVSAFYLKLMAGLAETVKKANHRATLLAADSPAALWKALVKTTRATVK